MKEYFESEMRLLQEAAQEFAEAYPEQAAMLNLKAVRDRDPYVERLLEGMAFLTAQVRERIDDGVPELSENLLDQINPSLCRPFPSYTLVRIDPIEDMAETVNIKRGTQVKSGKVGPEGIECKYFTTAPLAVQPVVVDRVSLSDKVDGGTRIQVQLKKQSEFKWSDLEFTELPIHLHCDPTMAYALHEVMTHPQVQVKLSLDRSALPCEPRMVPGMLEPGCCLLPTAGRGHVAYNLLHDYFNAREKYLFVKIEDFDSKKWPDQGDTLTLSLDSPVTLPPGHNVICETLQLNVVPAINLFKDQALPVRLTGKVPDYPLKVDRGAVKLDSTKTDEPLVDCINVYSVLDVIGRKVESGETRQFRPLQELSYRHADDPTYSTHTRRTGAGKRRTYISVTGVNPAEEETLAVEVLAYNESYPRQYLELGKIERIESEFSEQVVVSNISRPTKMLNPPATHDFQWQLISLMSLHLSKMDDVNHFQTLLSLFDWSGQVENSNRIKAIERMSTEVTNHIRKGVLVQGLRITLEIRDSGFSSQSDMYLFGTVLHNFFTAYANITEYVETKVISIPTYKEWLWTPRQGRRPIL